MSFIFQSSIHEACAQHTTFESDSFCQDHTDYCRVHERQCVVNKPRSHLDEKHFAGHGISSDSLIISSAGNCCQGWSTEGKRARSAHVSQHAWGCWIAQRKELAMRGQEDMFFQECTPHFAVKSCLVEPLSVSHHVVHMVLGPSKLGWPTSRDRVLSAGLSHETMVWLGPTNPEDVKMEFESTFGKSCQLSGSVFLQEDVSVQDEWCHKRLEKRGFHGCCPDAGQKLYRKILTPGQLQRLEQYQKLKDEHQGMDGTFFCDLDHWPSSPGPDFGPMFPVLLRHGAILELNTGRFAMNMDRFAALGFHVSAKFRPRFEWPLADFVAALPEKGIKELSGNCQSIPAILAWQLYVFCNAARKDPRHVCRSVSTHTDSDSDRD